MWMFLLCVCLFFQHLPFGIKSGSAVLVESDAGSGDLSPGTPESGCIKYPNATISVYIGWPFVPRCFEIIDRLRDYNDSLYTPYRRKNTTCTLYYSNGTVAATIVDQLRIFRRDVLTYYFDKFPSITVQDGINESFKMEFRIPDANFCARMDIYLNPESDPTAEEECTRVVQDKALHRHREISLGANLDLSCSVLEGPRLYFPIEDATFEWWYNCKKMLPNNTVIKSDKLLISPVHYSNPGEYLCAVNYGGRRRFLFLHKVCVDYRNIPIHSIKCNDVKAKPEEDLEITCTVDAGVGNDDSLGAFYFIDWLNNTNGNETRICKARFNIWRAPDPEADESRVTCEIFKESTSEMCYYNVTPLNEMTPSYQTLKIKLRIKNLNPWDAGQYHMLFRSYSNEPSKATVFISISAEEELRGNANSIAVALSILFAIIILALICFWKKIHILWFCKKHFGAFVRDDKRYVAYLAYHYNNEGMKERSKILTENLVSSLLKFMESIGATTYDDHKDKNEFQLHVENISKIQKECHRVIIILNEEYVTDHWDLHKAYLAMQNMAVHEAKLIFIPLPGVKKSFKQLPDEPKTALVHAMKISDTIKWDGQLPLSASFKHHLQYSLPKLKKNNIPDEVIANPQIQEDQV